jgi:hypothetical protein
MLACVEAHSMHGQDLKLFGETLVGWVTGLQLPGI